MSNKQIVVTEPLSPKILEELGVLKTIPPFDLGFSPTENRKMKYRIWTCHGYRNSGNKNTGFLHLEQKKLMKRNLHLKYIRKYLMSEG